ncbi:MAG: type II CAAX endopeptidase family protein [Sandaracinus sp.]
MSGEDGDEAGRARPSPEAAGRARVAGLALFLPIAFLGTWWMAASLRLASVELRGLDAATRMLAATVLYALTTAWPPLVALWLVRRFVEPRVPLEITGRAPRRGFGVLAVVAPLGLALGATLVASLAGVGIEETALAAPTEIARPSLASTLLVTAAAMGSLLLVWGQALAEEIGWRGFVLVRGMQRFGTWPGLWIHALLWGLWYVPVVLVTGPEGAPASLARVPSTFVTCALLGVLLGWLRVASQSLTTSVVANSIVTIATGAPFVVEGLDPGPRAALFGPIGWALLSAALLALLLLRRRVPLVLPDLSPPTGVSPALAERPPSSRVLH